MSKFKPALPKGTRDFGPEVLAGRNYIIDTIKDVYELFGFAPIETPTMELLSTLMGKYGDEGDQLLFKIINSGDYLSKADENALQRKSSTGLLKSISNKGLRYDLTVPFARYVVMNRNDIAFPFKRYQIQPVWRADKPQKGRYREFVQCDADIIGSNSLLNEVELLSIMTEVFDRLKLSKDLIEIKINNRKVLEGISEAIGASDQFRDITVAIDKLDKIGMEKVLEELKSKNLSEEACTKLQKFLSFSGDFAVTLDYLEKELSPVSQTGAKGVEELRETFALLENKDRFTLDLTLARGLNYYTGAIFEVVPKTIKMGSISGGGRYDDLTDIFGMPDVSGVGFSFGLDRIYDTMQELNLFSAINLSAASILFIGKNEEAQLFNLDKVRQLRKKGLPAEIYPEAAISGGKLKKQMKYANRRNFSNVVVTGVNEMEQRIIKVKTMETGQENSYSISELIIHLQQQS